MHLPPSFRRVCLGWPLLLSLFALFFVQSPASVEASHFRGGTLSYVITSGRTAKVTIDAYIRIGRGGGYGSLSWGDGSSSSFSPSGGTGSYLRRSVVSHRYSRDGLYTASWGSCCWIGGVSNRSSSWTHSIKIRIRSGHKGGPQFNSPAFFTSCTNAPFVANMNGQDPDRGRISYKAVKFPSGMTLNTSTGEVRWNSPRSGYHGFTVIGTSSASSATIHREVLLQIQGSCNNKPPTISLSPTTGTTKGGQRICTRVSASDPDRNRLTYIVTPSKPGATSPPSNQASPHSWTWCWTPSKADEGTRHDILFTVLDNGRPNLNAQARFLITVSTGSPPTISVSPSGTTKSVNEGSSVSFSVSTSDPDGNGIASFSVSGLPSFCSKSPSSSTSKYSITCRPGYTHGTRDYPITFTSKDRDGKPKTSSLRVTVRVNNVNRTPTISSPGNKTINEGQRLSFSLSASDPDGDRLTWSRSGLPSGSSFSTSGNSGTFTWTPNYNQSGVYTVKFTVTDSGSPRRSFTRSVVITVNNVNRRPTLSNPGNKTIFEGQSISFVFSASDPDNNSLTWTSSGIPSGARFSGSGTQGGFSWTPGFTQAGSYKVTVTVTDNGSPRLSASVSFTITVRDSNRPPVWSGGTSYTINENQSLGAKTLTATDPDNDKLTYSVGSVPTGFSASVSGNGTTRLTVTFNWKPTYSQSGTYRIVFSARDSKGATTTRTVTIVVRNVNRPPVLSNPGSKTVAEGATLRFTISGSDPDGNSFTWSNSTLPAGAKITGTGASRTFTWTPSYTQAGRVVVTFTIRDNGSPSLSASRSVAITVTNTNLRPKLSDPGSKTVAENSRLTFVITASDPDKDAITWKPVKLPTGARVTGTGNSRTFTWTPGFEQAGTYTIVFAVSDNGSPVLSATRSVKITVTNVNRPPRFTSKPPPTAIEDKLYTYRATATDPDLKAILTFRKIAGPSGSSVSSSGVVTWTPRDADAGKTFTFEIRVCDQLNACVNQKWTVKVTNVNDPPRITSKPILVATESVIYTYNPTFVDPDPGDKHTWSLVKGPPELNVDSSTGRVFWTPRPSTAGKTFDVEIRICDAAGSCATQNYKITVRNVNNPPKIVSTPPTVGIEGKTYAYNPRVEDNDAGDTQTWKLLRGAPRMTINSRGEVRWSPTNADVGKSYTIEIQVCDKANACDKQLWKVTTRNTNSPPRITSRPPTSATENKLFSYSPTYTDADAGDTQVWTLKQGPTAARVNPRTGLVSWTPEDADAAKSFTFQLELCDSAGACVSQTWTVRVTNVNDAPKITSTPATRVSEKKAYVYAATAKDPDPGEVLRWSLVRGPRGAAISSTSGRLSWQPGLSDAGKTYDFSIKVCDKANACDTQTWTVRVTNSNDAPTITSTAPTTATEDNDYVYSPTATDPDPSEVLSWKLVKGPKGAVVDVKTGKLTWKPSDRDAGSEVEFTIEVCDSAGACDTQTWKVKVTNVNDAPKITSTPNTVATEGRLYGYSPTFTDADANDTHTWRLLKSPKGATINKNTGQVEWTPGSGDAQKSFDFEIEICDNDRDCDTQKWTVKVLNINGAPTITSKPGTSVAEGGTYNYKPTFTDADPGDTHTWRGIDLPPGATINSKTGEVTWKPGTKEAGKTYTFEIEICDKVGKCDTQKWTVTVGNSNDAPTIVGTAPSEAFAGKKLKFSFRVEDNDPNDTHTWGFVKTHPGVSIDRSTGEITWTPSSSDAGKTLDFEIQVCDNGKPIKCAQKKFSIQVKQSCLVDVNCASGQICEKRLCVPATCTDKKPCSKGEFCIAGRCQQDPCLTTQCKANEICRPTDGKCIQPCAGVACSQGQICRDGSCQANPCAATPCKSTEVCDATTDPANPACIKNPCDTTTCRFGRVCDRDGACVDDPCGRMKCPSDAQRCVSGECLERAPCKVDSDCPGTDVCVRDRCRPANCYDKSAACTGGESCLEATCKKDPCLDSSGRSKCSVGEFCRRNDGKCAKPCANVNCPSGSRCVDGSCKVDACAKVKCAAGEVCIGGTCETDKCSATNPCKFNRVCNTRSNRCEDDPCAGVRCPDNKQVCRNGQCESPPSCSIDKDCPQGKLCKEGKCVIADCLKDSDCKADELCINGTCKTDSCKATTCDKGKVCKAGKCVDSCAGVYCARGEKCVDGRCVADPCANVTCSSGETCVNGTCVKDKCESLACREGRICVGDRCVADPCKGVTCPDGQTCKDGQCTGSLKCQFDRQCPGSAICVNGSCQKSDCYLQTCAEGRRCLDGECKNDLCANRNCADDEYCNTITGECKKSCPTCEGDQVCKDGKCIENPCKGVTCKDNEYCKDGTCKKDDCFAEKGATCKFRRICKDSRCQDDPCDSITCNKGETCLEGVCYRKPKVDEREDEPEQGDGGTTDEVPEDSADSAQADKGSGSSGDTRVIDGDILPAGGCDCQTFAGKSVPLMGLFLLFFFVSLRRRRR